MVPNGLSFLKKINQTNYYSQTSLLDKDIEFVSAKAEDSSDNSSELITKLPKYEILIPSNIYNGVSSSSNNKRSLNDSYSSSGSSKLVKSNKPQQNGDDGNNDSIQTLYPPDQIILEWKKRNKYCYPPGLRNNGNTCYLNSILQSLTYCPPLCNYILSLGDHARQCGVCGFCTLCFLTNHFRNAHYASNSVLDPHNLRLRGKSFNIRQQQDAHEFLSILRDQLIKDVLLQYRKDLKLARTQEFDNKTIRTTAIGQIFGGMYRNQVKCHNCQHSSYSYDYFLDTILDIHNVDSLKEGLEKFVKKEILRGCNAYKCSNCKQKSEAMKEYKFHQAPNVLTIHLKRFDNHNRKIDNVIQYPREIDLRPYMSTDGPKIMYKLFSVVLHYGSSSCGHYISYTNAPNGAWYKFDDSKVTQIGFPQVLNQRNAYMLFYVRDIKKIGPVNDFPREVSQPSVNKPKDANLFSNNFQHKIKSFNGNHQSKWSQSSSLSNGTKKRNDSDEDERNEEFDRLKAKKIKSNPKDCFRFNEFSYNSFEPKVKSWNGSQSKLIQSSSTSNGSKKRNDSDDEYNEEFDRGKSKKIKSNGKDCFRFNKFSYNPFQQSQAQLQQKS